MCNGMESVARRSALVSILGVGLTSSYALSASASTAPVGSLKESDCVRDCLKECKEIAPKVCGSYCTYVLCFKLAADNGSEI